MPTRETATPYRCLPPPSFSRYYSSPPALALKKPNTISARSASLFKTKSPHFAWPHIYQLLCPLSNDRGQERRGRRDRTGSASASCPNRDRGNECRAGRVGPHGVASVRKRKPCGGTEHRRLLCLCLGEIFRRTAAFQRWRFRTDRYPIRPVRLIGVGELGVDIGFQPGNSRGHRRLCSAA